MSFIYFALGIKDIYNVVSVTVDAGGYFGWWVW
jgi:hypothetical protein